jgi:hypothetical protein
MYDSTQDAIKIELNRIATALESIAASLERLSLPAVTITGEQK